MFKKLLSITISLAMLLSMSSTAFASTPKTAHFRVLEEHVNEDTKSGIQIAQWNQDTLYTFVSEEISYCSQTISDNKIQ